MFKLAIIGRPNVGKSTLFNRLTGKKTALVDPTPGVTRDRKEGEASIGPLTFVAIDTAGMEKAETESLEAYMMEQTQQAIVEADILLMMIDGRQGVTAMDEHFVEQVRRSNKPVILAVNKCEGNKAQGGIAESYQLGLGEPVAISAEHGDGLGDLYDALVEMCEQEGLDSEAVPELPDDQLFIAIAGRPNVGKSTFFNQLLGEQRAIASPVAGTTRDAIYVDWQYKDHAIQLVDTAGLRRRAKQENKLEKLSVNDSYRAIQYANVVILMVDGTDPMNKMDLHLADHILSEGRGMIIAVNKWDLVKDKKETLEDINTTLEYSLSQAKGVPVITLSALKGRQVNKVMDAALRLLKIWNQRITTSQLNRWLEHATSAHIPPLSKGKRIKLRYVTQIKTRPPTFALFTSSATKDLPDSYLLYLSNSLREHFNFQGVPIRMVVRKTKNPYAKS